jgi:DNA-binding transcriptional LysR family regulator
METKWLEDFVSLAETRSFSRSAALRHVTQPAFSRRIQALEGWLGAELIDRSGYPTRLTQAGNIFHAQALAMLNQAREARILLRGQGAMSATTIEFAVPHTLSLTFFPRWIDAVDAHLRPSAVPRKGAESALPAARSNERLRTRLRALNVHDAVLALTEGGCDLVMGYHHPSHPVALDPRRYAFLKLGEEIISPFCAPADEIDDGTGGGRGAAPRARSKRLKAGVRTYKAPKFSLPGSALQPAPYLAYSSGAYLAQMTDALMNQAAEPLFLDQMYETDMAEGLKSMAVAGHGIAFLPHSAAEDALLSGRLVPADGVPPIAAGEEHRATASRPAINAFSLTMEIRLYRDKLSGDADVARSGLIDAVWAAAEAEAKKSGKTAR